MITLNDIKIRTELKPGDIGQLTYLHGKIYSEERNHGIPFEVYVAEGLCEFYKEYDSNKERIWLCEYQSEIIGSILLKNNNGKAQLRFFLIHPNFRNIKLGNYLMSLFSEFMKNKGYKEAFLWTTNELDTASHLYNKFGFHLTETVPSNAFGKELCEQRYDLKL